MARMQFTIPGPPMGKPRQTRADRWKKRDCVLRYRSWADYARFCVLAAGLTLPAPEQIVDVSWTAYFAPPKSMSKVKQKALIGQRHRQKPDRDNVDKSLLDAIFHDDKGVADGTLRKRWDWEPRLEVTIEYEDIPLAASVAAAA